MNTEENTSVSTGAIFLSAINYICVKQGRKKLPQFKRYHCGKLAEINITSRTIFQSARQQ